MKNLREEYELQKERRKRAITGLVKEAILNVLAEQELDLSGGATSAPPVQAEPAQPQQQQQQQPQPGEEPPVSTPEQTVPKQYTVDDMIQELNAIRSGRSFTDPEIYGRLVTFFKNLSEEDRANLDNLLTQIAELVTGIEDALENQQGEQPAQQTTQSGQAQPQPPQEAPQQSAPMPGAQQAAGAAGVGSA